MAVARQKWTSSALAVELKKDRRTMASLLEGLEPIDPEEKFPKFYLNDVVQHVYENKKQKDTIDEYKKRTEKVRAEQAEMDLEKRRGTLLERDIVIDYYGSMVSNFRSKILAIPRQLAAVAVGLKEKEIEELASEFLEKTLNELSEDEPSAKKRKARIQRSSKTGKNSAKN